MIRETLWKIANVLLFAVLWGCGESRIDQLLSQLHSEHVAEQRLALQGLAELGAAAAPAIPQLIDLAAHAHPDVRRMSGYALSRITSELPSPAREEALPRVQEVFVRQLADKSMGVRNMAAFALLEIDADHPQAQRCLQQAMQQGDGGLIDRLTRIQPPPLWAVPTCVLLLNRHERPSIRRLSAIALGAIDPARAEVQTALKQALTDRDDAVRTAAQAALARTGG